MTGVLLSLFLVWVSKYMGAEFEERSVSGLKVGEEVAKEASSGAPAVANEYSELEMGELKVSGTTSGVVAQDEGDAVDEDTSCGLAEEGQQSRPLSRSASISKEEPAPGTSSSVVV